MRGFKSFGSAAQVIVGIETMHMVQKGQLGCPGGLALSQADYFYRLAAAWISGWHRTSKACRPSGERAFQTAS
jgi:hypothetical protein